MLTEKEGQAFVFCYYAPTVTTESFGDTLKRLLRDYNVQVIAGDYNARHPDWCTKHDDKRRVQELHRIVRQNKGYSINAPSLPTFQAVRNRSSSRLGSSTIDLVIAHAPIQNVKRLGGGAAGSSDHFPVKFEATVKIDRETMPRRIPKTLLQSTELREVIGLKYNLSMQIADAALDELLHRPKEDLDDATVQAGFDTAIKAIKEPWEALQAKKRRRNSGQHVNGEMCRLWTNKKKLYDRWPWKPTANNKTRYKEACRRTQQRKRQLIKEQEKRACQGIQQDPETGIALALRHSARRRKRQEELEKATRNNLDPKTSHYTWRTN